MHRAYDSTNAPVRAYWFDDRIEIISPGGPFGNVTPANFGQLGLADYRNPHLPEAMRVLNLVQRFGVGIATPQTALRENGNPPIEFQVDQSMVFARLHPFKL
jgi:ATP-dependent DNA helicase RecG